MVCSCAIGCDIHSMKKETVDKDPPIGIIKLNMSCTALSTNLTLLPYYHNEGKSDIQDHFIENLKEYDGSKIEIGKPLTTAITNFTKSDIP